MTVILNHLITVIVNHLIIVIVNHLMTVIVNHVMTVIVNHLMTVIVIIDNLSYLMTNSKPFKRGIILVFILYIGK